MKLKPNFSFLKNLKVKDNDKLKPLEWFKFDDEFKSLYNAEPEKIDRIVTSLANDGFDPSQPIIVTSDGKVIDGNSRLEAIRKYNLLYPDKQITELPYVIKEFDSKEEALLYEIHLNTDRRNLKDSDLLTSFKTLNEHKEKLKEQGLGTEEYTDKKLTEILNVSGRQISKMRYILKYGSQEMVDAIINGECTINNAESEIKKMLTPVTEEKKQSEVKQDVEQENEIRINDFILGVKFGLYSIKLGKKPNDIWNFINSKDKISFTKEQIKAIDSAINMN